METLHLLKSGLLAIVLASATFINAQEVSSVKERPRTYRHIKKDHFSKELNLSEQQQKELQTLNTNMRDKLKAIAKDSSLSKEEKRKQLAAVRAEFSDKRKNVLTPQQKELIDKKLQSYKEYRKKRGFAKWAHRGAHGWSKDGYAKSRKFSKKASNAYADSLRLTDSQKQKLKAIMLDTKKKALDIRHNTALNADERRHQFEALRKQHSAEVDKILTEEQKAIWQQYRKHRRPHKPSNA